MNQSSTLRNTISWPQVWTLIALDVAVIISWIAYHEYQPQLLKQFGFDHLGLEFAAVQGVILFLTPPIAGWIADNVRKQKGDRLPVMNLGITTVSMIFMVVAVTIFADPSGWITYLFPVMVVLWLISMNIFHSPAFSTVELFVPADKLPIVVAMLAVIADLAGAIQPVIVDIIDFFGAPITFAAGGILVFSTGILMMRTVKKLSGEDGKEENAAGYKEPKTSNFLAVFFMGGLVGFATTFLYDMTPAWAEARLPDFVDKDEGGLFASFMIAIAALAAFPAGMLAERMGTKKVSWIGLSVAALTGILIFFTEGTPAMVLWLTFPLGFSMMTVSYLPMAFLNLRSAERVFGIGIFFSGIELAGSIFNVMQQA